MDKTIYDRAQSKVAQARIAIADSKAYRQVTMRQLCKHMKVPADTWRGLAPKDIALLESLASNLVAYGRLTKPQWGLAKNKLATHK